MDNRGNIVHAAFSVCGRAETGGGPAPISAQGSKNCFNHLIPAAFASGPGAVLTLHNTPAISDRDVVRAMLADAGVTTSLAGSELTVVGGPVRPVIPPELGVRLRVTICYAAALAANLGQAWCPMPGGDAFTTRPIDVHVRVLEAAGARCTLGAGGGLLSIRFDRPPRPVTVGVGTPFGPSMGASVTALVVAALATGRSTLTDLSVEPEVLGLISMLRALGVGIRFEDTRTVRVHGVGGPLTGHAAATVPPDRIEAGTYLLAGLVRHERVTVAGIRPADFPEGFRETMEAVGVELTDQPAPGAAVTTGTRNALRPADVVTAPHPGFPTDLQPQMASFLTQADGRSWVTETIYRTRTTHVAELAKLGVEIAVHGRTQEIVGRQRPRRQATGQVTTVQDIRCGAAVLVAAAATSEPVLLADPAGHLARGYGHLGEKLSRLGMVLRPAGSTANTEPRSVRTVA